MKTIIIAFVAIVMATSSAIAVKGPQAVVTTRHNLSTTSAQYDQQWLAPGNNYDSSDEDEVCIFCHTPHGGTLAAPLWNRTMPTQTFTHYYNSSLSATMRALATTRPVENESLACLSCHDGAIATNSIINYSNDLGAVPTVPGDGKLMSMWFATGPNIGDSLDASGWAQGLSNDLSDDHPISFDYKTVSQADNGVTLRAVDVAESRGVEFYPRNSAAVKRVECPTCHDPHVNYEAGNSGDPEYSPFLITPNTGSNLCLACHIK